MDCLQPHIHTNVDVDDDDDVKFSTIDFFLTEIHTRVVWCAAYIVHAHSHCAQHKVGWNTLCQYLVNGKVPITERCFSFSVVIIQKWEDEVGGMKTHTHTHAHSIATNSVCVHHFLSIMSQFVTNYSFIICVTSSSYQHFKKKKKKNVSNRHSNGERADKCTWKGVEIYRSLCASCHNKCHFFFLQNRFLLHQKF